MEYVLHELLYCMCLVYLNDIISMAKKFDDMAKNLETIFSKLRQANLKLNKTKCFSFKKEVECLGWIVSERGKTADPKKIPAVIEWPIPFSKKHIMSFTGFANYSSN